MVIIVDVLFVSLIVVLFADIVHVGSILESVIDIVLVCVLPTLSAPVLGDQE